MTSSVSRRDFLRIAGASALAPMVRAQNKPNIVLILADDMGYADCGFQGSKEIPTPHLDALAAGGVKCTAGYISHPFCSPARAGLLTGRYQQRFGHENNMVFSRKDAVAGLPLTETTLADVLGKAGYKTGLVGKWHLGAHPRFHPAKRGFQQIYGFIGGGHDYFDAGNPTAEDQHFILLERDGEPVTTMDYLTTDLGREGAAFVRRNAGSPFFLYLAFNAPHSPLQAPQKYLDRVKHIADENRRTYAAMVAAMDDAIGAVLKAIRETRTEQNTLVIFLNDNGGPTGNASSNYPLRGTKRTVYEGGVRVPFVMSWPGRLPKGKVYAEPVSGLDVFPTALAVAGAQAPAGVQLDGVNILPYLEGKQSFAKPRPFFWRMFGGVYSAVREGRYKLVKNPDSPVELYDLEKDLGEKENIAARHPDVVRRLEATLKKWDSQMAKPLWKDHIFHKDELSG